MWVRGLKHLVPVDLGDVAQVAPYVGAWIETAHALQPLPRALSHPMWVRGLKLHSGDGGGVYLKSHPMWVRGLKPFADAFYSQTA